MTATRHAPLGLRSSIFRQGREASWRELEGLVAAAERRGIRALDESQLQRLPLLYRTSLSSLAIARSIALDRNLLLYLENLALRGFLVVYGPSSGMMTGLAGFLRRGFPAAVRGTGGPLLLALLAVVLGCFLGFRLVQLDEGWFDTLVPEALAATRGPSTGRQALLDEEIFAPWPGVAEAFVAFANVLFTHNTIVGFLTFGLGLAAGVPTLLLLAYQGLILGAFLALHAQRGLALDFIGWLTIHGTTEMAAILLCGAAGLRVAGRLLFPGRRGRLASLAEEGRIAAQIVAGAVLLFLVAGLIEGGLRQLVASAPWRLAIGTGVGGLWLAYFLRSGRGRAG